MIETTIKNNFPFLTDAGQGGAYLDNAASSQTPQVVLDAMHAYYVSSRANVHRGLYRASEEASGAYEDARVKVARFIGANPRGVIFTGGATASSNMLVSMLEHSKMVTKDDEIVTTVMEHHASMIPLQELARRTSAHLKHVPIQGESLDIDIAEKLITHKTKVVSVLLASNVTGEIIDVARIAEMAHKVGAFVMCDATAAIGHMPVDVRTLGVDALFFSGHKMCGPTGIGVLWVREELLEKLEPGTYGGGMVDAVTTTTATWGLIPNRFEAGTPPIAEAIGLGAAVDYLTNVGIENIRAHDEALVEEAIARLEKIPGVRVIAEKGQGKNIGIVSFVISGIHAHDVAYILGKENVAVRAGHHCAMPLHTALGVVATTRASFYLYNTREDVDALIRGIATVQHIFSTT
jgi:cysteine desulfurase/selenocysteine lyase